MPEQPKPTVRPRATPVRIAIQAAAPIALAGLLLVGGCAGPETTTTADSATGTSGAAPMRTASQLDPTITAANAALAGKDYAGALELFREILAENPTIASAYVGIAQVYEAQGEFNQAEPAFARAARLEPGNFDAQVGHGRVLQALQRYLESVRAYHRALTIRPESFEANFNMAVVYLALEEPASAVAFAEKAVQLRPDSGPARVALGTAYERMGRTRDAIDALETAMELEEPTPELLFALIRAYAQERRFEEAANTAEVLVRVAPSAAAYERLGWSLFRLGRYEESMTAYRNAVRVDEAYWPALNGVGVNALNQWLVSNRVDARAQTEARDAFRRSLRVNPAQPKVVRLLTTYQL